MKVHQSLPQNEAFFGYYAKLIPTLFKVGYLSQAFSACIETYILYSILLPKFEGVTGNPGGAALIGALFLVVLLEVGLRSSAAFSVRAILHRKFSGLDLPMSAFIFALSGSLLLCSIVLHIEGSKEAVELNASAPTLEETAHIESSGQTEAAELLRAYSQDSATVAATYSSRLKATKAAEAAKERAYLTKRGATSSGAAELQAKGADKFAKIEEDRAAKFEALLNSKAANLERIKSRQFSAADEIGGRNKKELERSETRTATYSSYLSTFSVLTVLFFLLTIALDEIHKKGSGIEEVAIAHQYQFEEPVLSKLSTALSGKFQYHARRAIDRLENSTPAPGAPLTPHPLYDWAGLTPKRIAMQTRERKHPGGLPGYSSANTVNSGGGDGRKQAPYLNGKHPGGGGDGGGVSFVATKQTPGGGGAANKPTTISSNTPGGSLGETLLKGANRGPGFTENTGERSAEGGSGREVFYFVDKDKAVHTIEHNGKHYTLRDVNSFITTYTKRAAAARKDGNQVTLSARLEALAYWESRREELLHVMQIA